MKTMLIVPDAEIVAVPYMIGTRMIKPLLPLLVLLPESGAGIVSARGHVNVEFL